MTGASELIAALSAGELIFLALSALIAGLARGFSGFGGALIFVPLASSVLGPKLAVPILLVIDMMLTLTMIPNAWRNAERPSVGTMALGAAIGIPAGAYLLTAVDPVAIRWGIATVVFALLVLLVSGWRYHGKPNVPTTMAVGVTSGLFSGAAQIGGPPVVAYWLGGFIPAVTVRANTVLYFAISSVISLVSYLMGGLITLEALILSLFVGPAFGIGLYFGSRMFGRSDEKLFRRVCFALIAAAAIIGLPVLDGVLR
jgi:uncharacterized membrane protein YfcA